MAKGTTKTTADTPKVQPAPPIPAVQPAPPLAPNGQPDSPGTPGQPTPGVIDPAKNPESNQIESPVPSSELPTGPLPPNATTVDTRAADEEDDGKGKPVTAQKAIDRVKDAEGDEFANDEHRKKAMKRWPNLFAETAKN